MAPTAEDAEYCDGDNCFYCNSWASSSNAAMWSALLIPILMGVGDVIVEEIVKCFARCKKPKNETRFLIDSILAIMWIQFVNLGFILIFMSLKVRWAPLEWL